jgi:hypothetical protein
VEWDDKLIRRTTYTWEYHTNLLFNIWRRIRALHFSDAGPPTYETTLKLHDSLDSEFQNVLTLEATTELGDSGKIAFFLTKR